MSQPSVPPGMVVAPKNPAVHLIVSFFIPGIGSMMNGETGKGIAILIFWILSVVFFWLVVPIFTAFALWIWGMVDAYTGAQKWNRAHNIVS